LQPVAVGVNGEIGYIAIQEGPVGMNTSVATTDMTMQHLHQSTLVSPVHLALGAPGNIATDPAMDPQTTGRIDFHSVNRFYCANDGKIMSQNPEMRTDLINYVFCYSDLFLLD